VNEVPPSDLPAETDLGRHRDFEGRNAGQWLRRGFLTLLLLFILAALANVFGQAAATDSAAGPAGTLSVKAPSRVRGGLTYQGEFTIHATRPMGAPTLVLDRGWVDQTTVNTVQPEPDSGSSVGTVNARASTFSIMATQPAKCGRTSRS